MDMRSRSDALAAVMSVFLPVLTISVGTLAALAVAAGGPVAARLRTVR
jgi:O-antigen ligase